MTSIILEAGDQAIDQAVSLLKSGELVAFPTETVYGLGADACQGKAVSSIFRVKDRPQFNPLIVHTASLSGAKKFGRFSPLAEKLAGHFWPGALTIVVPVRENSGLSSLVTAGLETVALRVPDHPVALALLEKFGGGLAAPSANISGCLSPTEAGHVEEGLGDRISLVLDGGDCTLGVESTILSVTEEGMILLRPGSITVSELEAVAGQEIRTYRQEKRNRPTSPGQLASHYAPNARVLLEATSSRPGEMFLAFGAGGPEAVPGLNLSPSGNMEEAAANLYAFLHILDGTGVDVINVMSIPEEGAGVAINDRLKRAAAPRDE